MSIFINKNILTKQILCHAWNKDRSAVAICPGDSQVQIYKVTWDGDKPSFELEHTLVTCESPIVCMDWAWETNRIAICSHDRNAHVLNWDETDQEWKVQLVLLGMNRAITSVRWSRDEQKFVVSTGGKSICVCNYLEDYNWWVSKVSTEVKIKAGDEFPAPVFQGTVCCVDFHPAGLHVACGSVDNKVRVVSNYVKGIDGRPGDDLPYPAKKKMMTVWEDDCGSWVNQVRFSPSGARLAVFCQASTIRVYETATGKAIVKKTRELPFTDAVWVDEDRLVCGGHDCAPYLMTVSEDSVTLKQIEAKAKTEEAPKKSAGFGSAMSVFQNLDVRGTKKATKKVETAHGSAICSIVRLDNGWISTVAYDGSLCLWKIE